jgi:quercetin dioxygenase-like cupin family protein
MGSIFRANERDVAWFDYEAGIRVKALTQGHADVPSMQFLEYGPDHVDPMHSHDTDEVFVVIDGELWLEGHDEANGPGSVVFVPRDTEYAVRGGSEGVRYFRIVVSAP